MEVRQYVAVRGLSGQLINVSMIQDMICSQDDAPCSQESPHEIQKHINTATSLEY